MTNGPETTYEEQTKFYYHPIGAGICTIAYQMSTNRGDKERSVKFGYSYCSPKDTFSKLDRIITKTRYLDENGNPFKVNGKFVKPKMTKDTWNKISKENYIEKIIPGGRTLSCDMLANNPVYLDFLIPRNSNAVKVAIEHMCSYTFENAPSWRDKFFIKKSKHGGFIIKGNEISVSIGDSRRDYIVGFKSLELREQGTEEIPCV